MPSATPELEQLRTDRTRLIGRLPVDRRRRLLDSIAREAAGATVRIERSYTRQLEGAHVDTGTIVGVAYAPTGGSSEVLVLQPSNPDLRMVAIPAAHVLRVRYAHPIKLPAQGDAPERRGYRLGRVIAGPDAAPRDEVTR